MRLLVTNDDGIDSPALPPLVGALSELGDVDVLVPDRERSWIGKAITRFEPVAVRAQRRAGLEMMTCSAYPADCVNLGIHSVFQEKPDLVVSGVNIGLNSGSAFVLSSGTVGAATEASLAGVPAIALSLGPAVADVDWASRARSEESRILWERAARVAAVIVERVFELGLPAEVDLLNVNMPEGAGPGTAVEVTALQSTRYGGLFSRGAGGDFVHRFSGLELCGGAMSGGDCDALARGAISITPLALGRSVDVGGGLRRRLEEPA